MVVGKSGMPTLAQIEMILQLGSQKVDEDGNYTSNGTYWLTNDNIASLVGLKNVDDVTKILRLSNGRRRKKGLEWLEKYKRSLQPDEDEEE